VALAVGAGAAEHSLKLHWSVPTYTYTLSVRQKQGSYAKAPGGNAAPGALLLWKKVLRPFLCVLDDKRTYYVTGGDGRRMNYRFAFSMENPRSVVEGL
jgi:hypothetical protein